MRLLELYFNQNKFLMEVGKISLFDFNQTVTRVSWRVSGEYLQDSTDDSSINKVETSLE